MVTESQNYNSNTSRSHYLSQPKQIKNDDINETKSDNSVAKPQISKDQADNFFDRQKKMLEQREKSVNRLKEQLKKQESDKLESSKYRTQSKSPNRLARDRS